MSKGNTAAVLLDFWRDELEAAGIYRRLAERERDSSRSEILNRLADAELKHAQMWADRLEAMGHSRPDPTDFKLSLGWQLSLEHAPVESVLHRMERIERDHVVEHSGSTGDPSSDEVMREIMSEDSHHQRTLEALLGARGDHLDSVNSRLQAILGRERWHRSSGGLISGAIYGVNDGLGAVFGIVAGVSGATGASHVVLISGLAGMFASALSMGAGAYLATKSEGEVEEAEIQRERIEFEEDPESEREEMVLFYQLKGLLENEAERLVDELLKNPEAFMETMNREELNLTSKSGQRPVPAAVAASVSTAVGALVPVIPFFWMTGVDAIIVAGAISLGAHFAVGAAKSIITVRSWLTSGLEMTLAGVFVGGLTYAAGVLVHMH